MEAKFGNYFKEEEEVVKDQVRRKLGIDDCF